MLLTDVTPIHSIKNKKKPKEKVETTQASTDRRMNKQNMVDTYNGIFFSLKKEENSHMCYNMDEP